MKVSLKTKQARELQKQGFSPNLFWDKEVALTYVQAVINPQVNDFINEAAKVATDAANVVMDKFFNWVGHNYFGDTPQAWNLGWKALDPGYVKMKGHSGFWIYTGKLRRQFYAKKGLKVFGATELLPVQAGRVNARGKNVLAKNIRLRLMPRLEKLTGGFKGESIASARVLEEAMFHMPGAFTNEMVRKLEGKKQYYRPLIGPALVRYVTKVLPPAVERALKQEGFKIRVFRNVGLGDQFGV